MLMSFALLVFWTRSMWPICVTFLSLTVIQPTTADQSMDALCYRSPNFGSGDYIEESNKCSLTYVVRTENQQAALDFCNMQNPASLQSVKNGENTMCDIISEMECNNGEILIGERCFMYNTDSLHRDAAASCKSLGVEYEFHKVSSTFEQKWIAAYYSEYLMFWIRNTESDLSSLLVADLKGKILTRTNNDIQTKNGNSPTYAIILRKSSAARLKAGMLAPMSTEARLPVLCSRAATPRQEYITSLADRMKEVGFKITMAEDAKGTRRPFTVIRGLHSFTVTHDYDAGTKRIHESCEAFENGYAASPFDFKNINDLKTVLKEAGVNIVAMPGRRRPQFVKENMQDCRRDPNFKTIRNQFIIDVKRADGSTFEKTVSGDSFWASGFPDRTCADMPRVALAFTQNGLVDVPNFARLFVVCTFGAPPNVQSDDGSEKCDPKADFDTSSKKCQCRSGYPDINNHDIFPKRDSDKTPESGMHCFNCAKHKEMDVFFIMHAADQSQGYWGWATVRCLKFAFSYYRAAVRLLLLGGSGIVHDTGTFYQVNWNGETGDKRDNKDFMFGMTDEYWAAPTSFPLKAGFEVAYKALRNRYRTRKLLVVLLQKKPNDLKETVEFLESMTRVTTNIEIFVAMKEGTPDDELKKLSSTGEIHSAGKDYETSCILGSKITNLMLRLLCIS